MVTFVLSPLTQPPSLTHHVPNNFIDPLEDAGLPGTKSLQNFSRRKAAKLAKVYKLPGCLWCSVTTDRSEKDNHKGEEGWDGDVESEASHSRGGDGGRMLSMLLMRNPQNRRNYIQKLLPRSNRERRRADLNCSIKNTSEDHQSRPPNVSNFFFHSCTVHAFQDSSGKSVRRRSQEKITQPSTSSLLHPWASSRDQRQLEATEVYWIHRKHREYRWRSGVRSKHYTTRRR